MTRLLDNGLRACAALLVALALLGGVGCGRDSANEVTLKTFTLHADDSAAPVTLPAHLNVPRDRTYTLRAIVPVPAAWRGQPLSLSIPNFLGLTELWVDGVQMHEREAAGDNDYRAVGPHAWLLPATDQPTLAVELRVRHTFTQSAWWDTTPRLSRGTAGDAATTRARWFNATLGGAALATLLIIAFTYVVIFINDRARTEYAFRALETLGAATYSAYVLGVGRSVHFEIPLLGFGLVTAASASLVTLTLKFQQKPLHKAWFWAWALYGVACVPFGGRYVASQALGPPCVALLTLMLGYNFIRLVRLLRERPPRPFVWPAFLSWLGLVIGAPIDFSVWLHLPDALEGIRVATLGLSAYALLQFVALSVALVTSLRHADALNAELRTNLTLAQEQKREIETLAVELRRQVASRSRQLADALSKLAADERTPLVPGDDVDGRYRVVRNIGEGAMGVVYEVERETDKRRFALKVCSRVFNTAELARFAREAQIASALQHPNVVGLVDINVASAGFMYLVMDLVDGRSLRECSDHFGDVDWAVPVLSEVAHGLASIHSSGIIHRDLKPANVLFANAAERGARPIVKITDFGIAGLAERSPRKSAGSTEQDAPKLEGRTDPPTQLTHAEGLSAQTRPRRRRAAKPPETGAEDVPRSSGSSSLTQTGLLLGTPDYMAPELGGSARNASAASDVFSLGLLAYELCTGDRPFAVPPCFAPKSEPFEKPSRLTAHGALSSEAAAAIDAALSFDPAERPTASAFAAALSGVPEAASGAAE